MFGSSERREARAHPEVPAIDFELAVQAILSVAKHTSADDDNIILPLFIPRSRIRTDTSTHLVEV